MKTNLLFALGLGLLTSLHVSAQYTVTNLNQEQQHADVSLVDWDNDGDLDLIISGETGAHVTTMVAYLNDGLGNYAVTTVPFTPITRSSFHWNDINQDGKLDLLENGFGPSGAFTGIYTSDGSGVFTADTTTLPQMSPTSGFADFNNDGYLDIYVFGNNDQGKSKILFNDKAGHFIDQHMFDNYTFTYDPDVSIVDFDNDGDLDMFISAGDTTPPGTPTAIRFSRLFKNDGGVLTEFATFSPEKGYGSSVWGDYDGDGYLDLLMNGSGIPNGDDFKYKLYHNNGGTSFTEVDSYIYGQFSTGGGGRFLDWDNDGDLDFIVTGWTGTRQATAIYLNNAGVFTEDPNNASLPGVSESSIEVGDIDNDGDLDLVITGFSGNDFDGAGSALNHPVSLVIKNPATLVNLPPTSPTNLHVTGTQSAITFSWDRATDATTPQASLSYNMFLYNIDSNKTFIYSNADTSTGRLRLQKLGNVQLNTGWILHDLPPGHYRWGVQAIDNSFAPSAFAKGNFVVNANGTLPVSLTAYNVKAENNKAKIEWTTGVEQNNDRFEIYRSGDGKTFTFLESVKGKGAGSNEYVVYDNNPSSGANYYRLLQYDANGQQKDQGIKTINFNTLDKATVISFPNPAYSEIGIRLSNYKGKQVDVNMIDMTGKIIHKETLAVNNSQGYYTLHLSTKPLSGQYILSVKGDNLKETLKVLVK